MTVNESRGDMSAFQVHSWLPACRCRRQGAAAGADISEPPAGFIDHKGIGVRRCRVASPHAGIDVGNQRGL